MTRVERSIYRDLLDVYYDTERMLTLDRTTLCRKVLARTPEEVEAVGAILSEFFHETPNGWWSDRCEFELDSYRKSTTQKSTAGKASAAARAAKREQAINGNSTAVPTAVATAVATAVPTAVERACNGTPTNQEPRTKNQEPRTIEVKPIAPPGGAVPVARGEVDEVFEYWQAQRGHDRAKLDEKRRKAIKARLKDGYTVGDLCHAVDGIARSSHHMGQNDQQAVYDDIELICRNAVNVDKFIKLAGPQQFTDLGLQRQVEILQDWMEKP